MPQIAQCPDPETLRQLALGLLPAQAIDPISHHLDSCPACIAFLSQCQLSDGLMQALRQPAAQAPTDAAVVDRLIERFARLHGDNEDSVAVMDASQETPAPEQSVAAAAGQANATVSFEASPSLRGSAEEGPVLRAPRGPGEIGWLGPYRVLKQLGQGGMGMVFLAEDPMLKRQVALKVMKPADDKGRQRFLREAQAVAAVKNDYIVTIYQVGEEGKTPYLAMELLRGESLQRWLKRGNKPSLAQVLRLGREMALGLAAAHEAGLIHRDIKPANIWLELPRGRVKILDFGLARQDIEHTGLTRLGDVLGTPSYMAPEQAQGVKVDRRCDLFSLGSVLYELCTGRKAFSAKETVETIQLVIGHQPPPPPQLNPQTPGDVSDLIMQLLAKKPAERPASAQLVAERLRKMAAQLSAPTVVAEAPPKRPQTAAANKKSGALPVLKAKTPKPAAKAADVAPSAVGNFWIVELSRHRKALVGAGVALLLCLVAFVVFRPKPEVPIVKDDKEKTPSKDKIVALAPEEITNSIGMKLRLIPAGEFAMGGGADGPTHRVRITKPFYMGMHEVTQAEYAAVMEKNPSYFAAANGGGPDHPVELVTWDDAVAFCDRLSSQPKEKALGRTYRLPTEAEWEYACRAGTSSAFSFGDTLTPEQAHCPVEKHKPDKTSKVGAYRANKWGLFDMHGNVFEWCQDWHVADYYRSSPMDDPPGPDVKTGSGRVVRGGSWMEGGPAASSANRSKFSPALGASSIGFRVVHRPPAE